MFNFYYTIEIHGFLGSVNDKIFLFYSEIETLSESFVKLQVNLSSDVLPWLAVVFPTKRRVVKSFILRRGKFRSYRDIKTLIYTYLQPHPFPRVPHRYLSYDIFILYHRIFIQYSYLRVEEQEFSWWLYWKPNPYLR